MTQHNTESPRSFNRDVLAQIGAFLVNSYRPATDNTTRNQAFESVIPTLNTAYRATTRTATGSSQEPPTELQTMIREYQPRLTQLHNVNIARDIARYAAVTRFENLAEAQAWTSILTTALNTILQGDYDSSGRT